MYNTMRRKILLAAHSKRHLHINQRFSFVFLNRPQHKQTKETLPVSAFRTISVCGQKHTRSVAKNKIRKPALRDDNGSVLKTSSRDTNIPNNCHCIRSNIRRPLDSKLRYPIDDNNGQRPAVHRKVLPCRTRRASHKPAHDNLVPLTNEWVGKAIQRNNRFTTLSLCLQAPI